MLAEPQLVLESLRRLIVIDEIQRQPDLFPLLRYLVDTKKQKYLILGSASRDLIKQSSDEHLHTATISEEILPENTLVLPISNLQCLKT